MRARIILVIISIFVALIAVEVILRIAWTNPYANSTPDKILELRLHHKNINQTFNRELIDKAVPEISFRTNDRNYIEPSFRFDNPNFTVVFMGGSTSECIAVQHNKRFPFLVSKQLESKGLKVNTLNAARSGGTIHDSINILFNHVALDHPDVIIFMEVTNEIGVLTKDKTYSSRMGHDISSRDIAIYSLQLLSVNSSVFGFLREKQTASAPFLLSSPQELQPDKCKIDPKPFIARLNIFVAMCRALDIIPILVTQPLSINIKNELTPGWINENCQKLFNNCIREVSKKNDVDLIDLSLFISQKVQNKDELIKIFYDGLHVTDYGSELYASHISENLFKILNKRKLGH